jgi:general secretion pathway protein G
MCPSRTDAAPRAPLLVSVGRGAHGFTLLELLITLAILATLASGAVSLLEISASRAKEADLRLALRQIRQAIDAFKAASDKGLISKASGASGYPPHLELLASGVTNITDPGGHKIYFLRRIPRDPMADPALPAEQSWGLRSYSSDPDNPSPGEDVYDVYSLSSKTGLNGIPYRKW